jgi:hypothetical protein
MIAGGLPVTARPPDKALPRERKEFHPIVAAAPLAGAERAGGRFACFAPTLVETVVRAARRDFSADARGGLEDREMSEISETTFSDADYPVVVRARLDDNLSRWLWLVKWILLIPHFIALIFLGIAFFVITVIAFFAILITGRYPRGLFDFNLGVLRWSWRVSYYGYSALGTDRYPPFTLAAVPDYPATLEIAYPEQLSRGLVLIKWWLLALPHYALVAVFTGGAVWTQNTMHHGQTTWQGSATGLISLCVIFAAIALLFTERYPRGLYNLVTGMDRWSLRVVAYAFLMTDVYPPFRLDQGGDDPGSITPVAAPTVPIVTD